MKKYIILTILSLSLIGISSCEKNDEARKVVYQISDNQSGFEVSYRNASGEVKKEQVIPESKEDVWKYTFEAREGEIIYVSGIYDDVTTGIKVQILLDGKLFKEKSSLYDTLNYVIVSGTVPFE
ncbi:MAG: hypothetical protein K9G58_12385 [Bacteroidales bacterium]|nr:hypothetical protein [Bacteroidales bacterium]MCF8386768.1 hypothetical protein [Bacteroidales bacterium]MCF8398963.1 hypothetical protein [Bacteroidales bacterium]